MWDLINFVGNTLLRFLSSKFPLLCQLEVLKQNRPQYFTKTRWYSLGCIFLNLLELTLFKLLDIFTWHCGIWKILCPSYTGKFLMSASFKKHPLSILAHVVKLYNDTIWWYYNDEIKFMISCCKCFCFYLPIEQVMSCIDINNNLFSILLGCL